MAFDRFGRALLALATAVALSACVTVGPVASPTVGPTIQPTPSPSPVASPTQAPTLAPTTAPTTAPTLAPTIPPTAAPTAQPTAQPTSPPTESPTKAPTPPATAAPTAPPNGERLDFTLDPNYGVLDIESGFVPDPRTVEVTSGGPVDVSYLGNGCTGFATAAPDYSVRYSVGTPSSLLRIYFEGSGDTTLIINDQSGSWLCVDDSFNTLNPAIDFNNPSGGRYDIWVGSYSRDVPVLGTLSITELSDNHP